MMFRKRKLKELSGTKMEGVEVNTGDKSRDEGQKKKLAKLLDPEINKSLVDKDIASPELVEIFKGLARVNDIPYTFSYIDSYPARVAPGWLASTFSWKIYNVEMAMFIDPIDETAVINELNRRITNLEAELSEMARKGRTDTTHIEQELRFLYRYRDDVVARRTRLFRLSTYFAVSGEKGAPNEVVEDFYTDFDRYFRGFGAHLKRIRYKVEDAYKIFLPDGGDVLDRKILADSDSVATCFPFVYPTVMHETGILYGFDLSTKMPLIIDRFKFAGHNEVIVGGVGSGKSFFAKLQAFRWYLNDPNVRIFFVDPVGGFKDIAMTMGAQIIRVGRDRMNIMELHVGEDMSWEDAVREKVGAVMLFFNAFFEAELGNPLDKTESGILRRAILEAYHKKGTGEYSPTIDDVIEILEKGDILETEEERTAANRIKPAFDAFRGGEFSTFNGQTGIDITNRVVYFDFSSEGGTTKSPLQRQAVLTWISTLVKKDTKTRKIVFIDEAHDFLKYPSLRAFLETEVRHSRHYKVGYTFITQSFEEFLNDKGLVILDNASVVTIFRLSSIPEQIKSMLGIPASGEEFVRSAMQGKVAGRASALMVIKDHGVFHVQVEASELEKFEFGRSGRGV